MKGPDMKAYNLANERAATLEAHFGVPNVTPRPIITSLNGDDSWLLSLPAPAGSGHAQHYFHVVVDPWLAGQANVGVSYFMSMLPGETPAVVDGAGVEAIARQIDDAADAALGPAPAAAGDDSSAKSSSSSSRIGLIITAGFAEDHTHVPTLATFDKGIPTIIVADAVKTVKNMKHFDRVTAMPELFPDKDDPSGKGDWRSLHPGVAATGLPAWLSVFRVSGGLLGQMQNWGTIIAWSSADETTHEAVLYSAHGVGADTPGVQALARADPPIRYAALLHSLVDGFTMGMRATTGVAGGLALERAFKPRCWIESHNSELQYGGVWKYAIKNIPRTIEDGLVEEAKKNGGEQRPPPNFLQVKNGTSYVMA